VHDFRPPHVVAEDAALAQALRDGHEAAVRTLYQRYGRLVFTVASRVVRDRHRAEEVTQQTFLQAWRYADRFEPGRDFAPWLATIARRAAIDAQRREARRPADSLETTRADEPALVELPPSAEELETVWSVRAAIDALGDEEREIVRLHHLEGLTHRQIAEHLDVPVGTVKSRAHRAHRRLANLLSALRQEAE
jgi:RNA polymerase sigma-70 factor (ECF subfamily)